MKTFCDNNKHFVVKYWMQEMLDSRRQINMKCIHKSVKTTKKRRKDEEKHEKKLEKSFRIHFPWLLQICISLSLSSPPSRLLIFHNLFTFPPASTEEDVEIAMSALVCGVERVFGYHRKREKREGLTTMNDETATKQKAEVMKSLVQLFLPFIFTSNHLQLRLSCVCILARHVSIVEGERSQQALQVSCKTTAKLPASMISTLFFLALPASSLCPACTPSSSFKLHIVSSKKSSVENDFLLLKHF